MTGRRTTNEGAALARLFAAATDTSDPAAALAAARALRAGLYDWEGVLARDAVDRGASWDEVGKILGISRQAAWSRFSKPPSGSIAIREARDRIDAARRRSGA